VRGLLDDGHPLSSAQLIVRLQDDLTDARDERDVARQQLRDQAG
jgi:MerR family transcriptional regulator, heat shock protein HspR